jgi:hypothetical protein
MPDLRTHLKASKRLLGTQNPLVHRILDLPTRTLEHRFRHTPRTVAAIAELFGEDARREAWLHLFMDWGIVEEKDWRRQLAKTSEVTSRSRRANQRQVTKWKRRMRIRRAEQGKVTSSVRRAKSKQATKVPRRANFEEVTKKSTGEPMSHR